MRYLVFLAAILVPAAVLANPKIHKDAVTPYTQKGYPKFFQQWGAGGMKRINAQLPQVAKKVAASPECDRVDLVELSGNRSVPPKQAVYFVDCKNGKRFYVADTELKSNTAAESKQAKTAALGNSRAIEMCDSGIKSQLQYPLSFKRKNPSVYRAPTGNVVVEYAFSVKNALGGELPHKARCVITDRGLESAEISNG